MTAIASPRRQLALLGASGHGKVVAESALAAGWGMVAFFDDSWPQSAANGRWSVVGDTAHLMARLAEFDGVLVAIGNAAVRVRKQEDLRQAGAKLVSVVHPRAWVSPSATLGAGSVVMPGAVINADAVLGLACIVNTGASVDHDCRLAEGVHISPGAHLCGGVSVGACSWVGVGAAVRQGIRIGAGVTVGAGAVVVKDVPDGLTVVGCPAAPLAANRAVQG
ncbi:acetyltransferase [Variovorax sp.]|uniref:acetyltransferase n=1 Tax=Variovorax sp. TaxID=1871043 RepID=UPI002D5D6C4C|nr:acetyltransferase [Variovorax sp.]HYP86213.1 acetyltransferase [Variovorax sp.]